MVEKRASTDYPIHELLATRWSPYAFQDRPVSEDDLRSLFEAARWAASSFNEQPWTYIVATKEQPEEFQQVLVLPRRIQSSLGKGCTCAGVGHREPDICTQRPNQSRGCA